MSYILEALKKSEQERGHGDTPSVQTIHTSSLQYQQKQRSIWPALLTVAVTLNLVALGYFIYDNENPPQAATVSTQQLAQQPRTSASIVERQPVAVFEETAPHTVATGTVAPRPDSAQTQTPQAIVIDTATTPPEPGEAEYHDDIAASVLDLPTDVQASIPDLTFSAHVYSSNPKQRSVVINGDFMEEGDMLTASLRLDRITNDGVVFDYKGMRFYSSVVSGWSTN